MGSEIIFVVPYVAGFAAVVTIAGTFIIWLIWAGVRRWRPGAMRRGSTAFPTRLVSSALLCIALPAGCIWALQPVPQPESGRTVAAFEVPLNTAADRAEFLAILGREAAAEGLNISSESEEALERWNEMSPDFRRTISVDIWRDDARTGNEARVSDQFHPGDVWISFKQGEDPATALRFRERMMRQTFNRWPGTLPIPVAATGALPHKRDLVLGDRGYEIDPRSLSEYACGPASPGSRGATPGSCQ